MRSKEKCLKMRFSICLWAIIMVSLYNTPCSAISGEQDLESGDVLNLGTEYAPDYIGVDSGDVDVYEGGTLNMYSGSYVDWGIYVYPLICTS
jgi:hypothetical protein